MRKSDRTVAKQRYRSAGADKGGTGGSGVEGAKDRRECYQGGGGFYLTSPLGDRARPVYIKMIGE